MAPYGQEILALGVDIVALPRFADFLRRQEEYLGEVFTPAELEAAAGPRREVRLAACWALKEAALKALGTGWGRGVQWTDVEVAGDVFAPRLRLHAGAARALAERGATALVASVACAGACVVGLAALARAPGGSRPAAVGRVSSGARGA